MSSGQVYYTMMHFWVVKFVHTGFNSHKIKSTIQFNSRMKDPANETPSCCVPHTVSVHCISVSVHSLLNKFFDEKYSFINNLI